MLHIPWHSGFCFLRLLYLFVCARSELQHAGSSVAACAILSGGMWDLVPWPGIKPGLPTWGAWSLSHWTQHSVNKCSGRCQEGRSQCCQDTCNISRGKETSHAFWQHATEGTIKRGKARVQYVPGPMLASWQVPFEHLGKKLGPSCCWERK